MSGRLGELLVRENLISVQQLRKAQEEQQKTGTRIGTALIKVGAIEESKLTDFLSKQYGVPAINLKEFDVEPDIIKLVPKDVAEKHLVVPVNRAGSALIVAMCDPSNIYAVDDLKFLTGYNIEAVVASEPAIREAIERYYAEKGPSLEDIVGGMGDDDVEIAEAADDNVEEALKAADDAPVIKLVNLILKDAISKRASDIHIEPYEKDFRVRFRIDGVMYEVMKPPIKLRNAIISRVKIMSSLDISERRLPQDGRIKIKLGGGKEMDFRVSVCPTLFGEKIVMRLLDKSNLQLDMTKLGLRCRAPQVVQGGHRPPLRDGAGDRPHGFRQDHHAVLGARGPQRPDHQRLHRRRPRRVQLRRHQPGADAGLHRPELRGRPAQLPPAGPRHHHDR